jgi:hypothetical protein
MLLELAKPVAIWPRTKPVGYAVFATIFVKGSTS